MDVCRRGRLFASLCNFGCERLPGVLNQVRNYAARKGTRAKADKKKVKKEVKKVGFIPHNLRKKDSEHGLSKQSLEHKKQKAIDDVYPAKYFAWREFSFVEALECHRETHHPTAYNQPNAPVQLYIELDMSTPRPTRFVDKFRRMAMLPHGFGQGVERSIMVFCKTPEQTLAAQDAGATLVGGTDIIREIEKGKIVLPDFQFVVAHPSILPEMVTIRGLLKKKFPSPTLGTLGVDIGAIVTKFKNGVDYNAVKDTNSPAFGRIDTVIGKLNMETKHLEENFRAMIDDINNQRPKGGGEFISRIVMYSSFSVERLKIDLTPYRIVVEKDTEFDSSDDEDDDVQTSAIQA